MLALTTMLCNLNAQTKTTNFYELIKSALPDRNSAVKFVSWQKGIFLNPTVKWDRKTPMKNGEKGYIKTGNAKILLPSKKSDEVGVTINGTSLQGYLELTIEASMIEDYTLEKLMGNKNCSITLLKKEGEYHPFYNYQVKFPGKKNVWIMLMPVSYSGALNPSEEEPRLSIWVLFDDDDYKTRAS